MGDKTLYYCYYVSESGKVLTGGYIYALNERHARELAEAGDVPGTRLSSHTVNGDWVITTEPFYYDE